jgi:hypothetical protein
VVLEALRFKAERDGSTIHITLRWLEFKTGYGDKTVSRALAALSKAGRIATRSNGRGLSISLIPEAETADKMSGLTRQNVRSDIGPSINLPEQEKPKDNSNSKAAAAAETQSEKPKAKVTEMPDPEVVAEMTSRGVWPSVARKYARNYSKERVMNAVAYTAQATGVREIPAFLIEAIREGWKLPDPAPAPAMKTCTCCGKYFDPAQEGFWGGKCLQCAEDDEKQKLSRSGRQVSTDPEGLSERMETQTPVEPRGGRGRPAAVCEPKCRKCGLPINADRLGTHGMHFACDEWSRG